MAYCGNLPLDRRVEGAMQKFRVERQLDAPPALVWEMLTRPERLESWFAPGSIEGREGGRARFVFPGSGTVIDSDVTWFDEGRGLAFSWSGADEPSRPVRWEIVPAGDGSLLSVDLAVPQEEDAAKMFAGWVAHLEMLAASISGAPIPFPFDQFKAAREAYNAPAEGSR